MLNYSMLLFLQNPTLKKLISKTRVVLKNLETLTYNFQECNCKDAQDLAEQLEDLYTIFYVLMFA